MADKLYDGLLNHTLSARLNDFIVSFWGRMVNFLSGNPLPQDYTLEIEALTTAKALTFNQEYPGGMPTEYCGQGASQDDNGIYYFSWTGNKVLTNIFDISDVLMLITASMMDEPNDGLVPVCSTHLGTVIRDDYRMNHMDAVDQMFGLHSSRDTDPPVVYRQQANRLQGLGL